MTEKVYRENNRAAAGGYGLTECFQPRMDVYKLYIICDGGHLCEVNNGVNM